ncbi:MAG: hypothetical protein ABSC94_09725 [Polyangiaceae bacterium]|jgi:hypothetical protein
MTEETCSHAGGTHAQPARFGLADVRPRRVRPLADPNAPNRQTRRRHDRHEKASVAWSVSLFKQSAREHSADGQRSGHGTGIPDAVVMVGMICKHIS